MRGMLLARRDASKRAAAVATDASRACESALQSSHARAAHLRAALDERTARWREANGHADAARAAYAHAAQYVGVDGDGRDATRFAALAAEHERESDVAEADARALGGAAAREDERLLELQQVGRTR